MFYLTFFFYPKWNNLKTEATISWDVSGYYMYLPAIFIYHDIKECKFKDDIMEKYGPTPDFQQGLKMDNGNYVMKYSSGQALQYAPFFFIAHWWATNSDEYLADGFSFPYQFMITIESFLIALLGLWFLRLILLRYFKDKVVAITMLGIVLGSNYLEFSTMAGAMTHNNLFTIYTLLIFVTIKFHEKPRYLYALLIGFLVGLATLTRPTELISLFIPLLWGLLPNKQALVERIDFFKSNFKYLSLAIFTTILVGSIQLIYWKYVSGDWFVYSYNNQGFKLLKPHLWLGIFSYRSGWLVYSPMMAFSLIGFYFLRKNHLKLYVGTLVFAILFIYWTFAWNIWWYGGSLGIRAMVQSYAILAFPFAGFVAHTLKTKYWKYGFTFLFIIFSYYNLWLSYQAHWGGILKPGFMTKAYFWKTLGRYKLDENNLKLLDTKEEFTGERKNIQLVYENDFENDTTINKCELQPIQDNFSLCLDKENQYSPQFKINKPTERKKWIRVSADFKAPFKEWDVWKMTQFVIQFLDKENNIIKRRMIRIHRFLSNGQQRNIYFDTKLPKETYKKINVFLWNSSSEKQILVDNLKMEIYD